MKKRILNNLLIPGLCLTVIWTACAYAAEPERPDVNTKFDPQTEAAIAGLASVPVDAVYITLEDKKFFGNEKLLYKAIFKAFGNRKKDALDFAAGTLKAPLLQKAGSGPLVSSYRVFSLSKKVLEVFPDETVTLLTDLFNSGEPVTKRNVINASGNVTGTRIRKLLIAALDDKTESGEIYPELLGEQMRICDHAYNQLVLRYGVQNVLRTIGTAYEIDVRDSHINILKDLIGKGKVE